MQTFYVKTASQTENVINPHFFILNKGMNSGKPLLLSCPNCFKIETESEEIRDVLYWISYALWKSKAFHPYLIGSVIPFIRIGDFKHIICQNLKVVNKHPAEFSKTIEKLKVIEIKENLLKENLRLVQDLKFAYIQSYFVKNC